MEILKLKYIIIEFKNSMVKINCRNRTKGTISDLNIKIHPGSIRKYINMLIDISMSINKNVLKKNIHNRTQRGKR